MNRTLRCVEQMWFNYFMERDFPSHCSSKIYCFNKSAIPLGDLGLSRNQTYLSMRAHVSISARIISTHVAHKKQLLQSSDSKIPSGLGWIPYHIDGMESRLKSAQWDNPQFNPSCLQLPKQLHWSQRRLISLFSFFPHFYLFFLAALSRTRTCRLSPPWSR